jgi:hypothetical protein
MVAEHIARADNHRVLLTNESDENRKGKDRNKRGAPPSHKPDEFHRGHIGVACAPRGRPRPSRGSHKRLRDHMVWHFISFRGVAKVRAKRVLLKQFQTLIAAVRG